MYISRGFIYLVEIWFAIAKSVVIIVEVCMGMGIPILMGFRWE